MISLAGLLCLHFAAHITQLQRLTIRWTNKTSTLDELSIQVKINDATYIYFILPGAMQAYCPQMNALCMDPDSSYPYNLTWKRSQKLYTADSRNKTENEMCSLSLATLSSYFCYPLFLQFRFCRPRDQKSPFCTFPSNVLKGLPCYN
ncbi:hypothetical protein NC651_020029 [Populus alba x Populus x berolinensis]|nr:hypothetical protein NC651_020029 [Populus alba x Populus x berolinensis]